MNDELTTPSAGSDEAAPSSEYNFQSLLLAEVNVDRADITMDQAYEIYKEVRHTHWPKDSRIYPSPTPYQTADGTTILYNETPHAYHDLLGLTEQGFDKNILSHYEAHFPDGRVFGERDHIQTTGKGDDLTATKIRIFYAFRPDGETGCEWNAGIGFRPIRSIAPPATDTSGTPVPVSYELTPVAIAEEDRSCLSKPQDFVSDTCADRPITSLICPSQVGCRHYPLERTWHDQSDVRQNLVMCWTPTSRSQGAAPGGKLHLIPANIDEEVKKVKNTTSFIWKNSWEYRPQRPVSPAPTPSDGSTWPRGERYTLWARIS